MQTFYATTSAIVIAQIVFAIGAWMAMHNDERPIAGVFIVLQVLTTICFAAAVPFLRFSQ